MKLREALTPTQRTRRYNKKNRGKVRAYLRKTQDDRVQRGRDRRAAEKKHGKAYMKNKDVHHPNGVNGGKWVSVPKDHGPDKKKNKKESSVNESFSSGGTWIDDRGKKIDIGGEPHYRYAAKHFDVDNDLAYDIAFSEGWIRVSYFPSGRREINVMYDEKRINKKSLDTLYDEIIDTKSAKYIILDYNKMKAAKVMTREQFLEKMT